MPIKQILKDENSLIPVRVYTDDLEERARQQLLNLSQLSIIHNHIAAMPDVHCGKGATIGSVIPTLNAIIPAAVGVDIGCGMSAIRLSLKASQLPDNLNSTRHSIERTIPVGFAKHNKDVAKDSVIRLLNPGLESILDKHPKIRSKRMTTPTGSWVRQIATLGGGNHFIELCLDENDNVWVMLHSGSRGIGNKIGTYFIELAKKDMVDQLGSLPDKDLAYFREGSPNFNDYVEAVHWAQEYASYNRKEMMRLIIDNLRHMLPSFKVTKEAINCHHNYVSIEHHYGKDVFITRKGAIDASEGKLGIIPGSMGAKSFIVSGTGNHESFHSCAHGAGRKMSRTKAKKAFNVDDMVLQTEGVNCKKDSTFIDEIPGAYKDIDEVMQNQTDLVNVVHTLKQVLCVKG